MLILFWRNSTRLGKQSVYLDLDAVVYVYKPPLCSP